MNIGDTFGLWTVTAIGFIAAGSKRRAAADCVCRCGVQKRLKEAYLLRGESKSCGCLQRASVTTHGMTKSPEFEIWSSMRARCSNQKHKHFASYGGRGIVVCKRWESFELFFSDMGPRPSPQHELDRRDNGGNYEPGNCRWVTSIQQQRNKRNSRVLTINGLSLSPIGWSEVSGVDNGTIVARLNRGWSASDAVFTPAKKPKRLTV